MKLKKNNRNFRINNPLLLQDCRINQSNKLCFSVIISRV